jgi:hypothetical protein
MLLRAVLNCVDLQKQQVLRKWNRLCVDKSLIKDYNPSETGAPPTEEA